MIGCRWLMDRRDEAAGVARNQRRLIVTKFSWRKATLVAAVVPMLALSACSSTGGKPADSGNAAGGGQAASTSAHQGRPYHPRRRPVTRSGTSFARAPRRQSAKDNVELLYTSDPEAGRQAQLIQQAIDQKVDGIAVTLAKPEALKDVLKKATDAGIPIVSLNAGESTSPRSSEHSPTSVPTSSSPVEAVGTKLAADGYKHPVCVIQAQGHVGLEAAVRRRQGEGARNGDPLRQRQAI